MPQYSTGPKKNFSEFYTYTSLFFNLLSRLSKKPAVFWRACLKPKKRVSQPFFWKIFFFYASHPPRRYPLKNWARTLQLHSLLNGATEVPKIIFFRLSSKWEFLKTVLAKIRENNLGAYFYINFMGYTFLYSTFFEEFYIIDYENQLY